MLSNSFFLVAELLYEVIYYITSYLPITIIEDVKYCAYKNSDYIIIKYLTTAINKTNYIYLYTNKQTLYYVIIFK